MASENVLNYPTDSHHYLIPMYGQVNSNCITKSLPSLAISFFFLLGRHKLKTSTEREVQKAE